MVKCAKDLPIPSRRTLLLQRLQTTVGRGDPRSLSSQQLIIYSLLQLTPAFVIHVAAPEWEIADKPYDYGAAGGILTQTDKI
jgi:hypothetical protein